MQNRQVTTTSEPTDLSDITAKVQFLLNDLSWTQKQERDYLEQTYGEKTRSLLSEEKLRDFLLYLETLKTP